MSSTREVVVDGVRLAVNERGRAASPAMMMLHALGERASSWDDAADRLAGSFRVFAPDLRGHGDSDRPGSYSFEAMRDDVIGLLDQLGLESTILVGHSMGGVVAYLVAIERPDLVDRLIIEDVSPPYKRDHPIPAEPGDTGSLGFDWAVVPAIIAEVNAGAPEIWASLETIAAPTLVIGGGEDSHIPQVKLREVADRIPRCELRTVRAGHDVHKSEPDQFIAAIDSWLSA